MLRGDQTGPMGMGAMTGRAAGYCAGFGAPGYENPIPGRGFRRGFLRDRNALDNGFGGGRHGWRHMFYASGLPRWMRFGGYAARYQYQTPFQKPDPEIEKQALQIQAQLLRSELDSIEKRLAELNTGTKEKQAWLSNTQVDITAGCRAWH
jgi:hypothetical protein